MGHDALLISIIWLCGKRNDNWVFLLNSQLSHSFSTSFLSFSLFFFFFLLLLHLRFTHLYKRRTGSTAHTVKSLRWSQNAIFLFVFCLKQIAKSYYMSLLSNHFIFYLFCIFVVCLHVEEWLLFACFSSFFFIYYYIVNSKWIFLEYPVNTSATNKKRRMTFLFFICSGRRFFFFFAFLLKPFFFYNFLLFFSFVFRAALLCFSPPVRGFLKFFLVWVCRPCSSISFTVGTQEKKKKTKKRLENLIVTNKEEIPNKIIFVSQEKNMRFCRSTSDFFFHFRWILNFLTMLHSCWILFILFFALKAFLDLIKILFPSQITLPRSSFISILFVFFFCFSIFFVVDSTRNEGATVFSFKK